MTLITVNRLPVSLAPNETNRYFHVTDLILHDDEFLNREIAADEKRQTAFQLLMDLQSQIIDDSSSADDGEYHLCLIHTFHDQHLH